MKKTIWITGTLLAIGIAIILVYFSFFQGKDSSTMPEGTFVKDIKEVEDEIEGLKVTLASEWVLVKGAEIEWRQSA